MMLFGPSSRLVIVVIGFEMEVGKVREIMCLVETSVSNSRDSLKITSHLEQLTTQHSDNESRQDRPLTHHAVHIRPFIHHPKQQACRQ